MDAKAHLKHVKYPSFRNEVISDQAQDFNLYVQRLQSRQSLVLETKKETFVVPILAFSSIIKVLDHVNSFSTK